ncbi:hypothetical protein PC9H_006991 [Pleurotus ostreatus]|uniref:Uncharacterized protein n=1 Tax=Pleurotus ostreatus TaxID=5322 RepID=A0A8H6ZSR3_PLEOS|nr:uncharacterized protein PC9H_006991 [Pleurotus ostreatus]KAF7427776.1 hypothetical protein PC9H_006991 [Pleurotus ostreatus]
MSDEDHQRYLIYIEAIRIRVKSPDLNHANQQAGYPTCVTISLKVGGETRDEKGNWRWMDSNWVLRSPVEICPNDRALVEIRPGHPGSTDSEVLASVTFKDIMAAVRSREQTNVEFQQEHRLATITICFRVCDGCITSKGRADDAKPIRRRDTLKTRLPGHLDIDKPLKHNERHASSLDYWTSVIHDGMDSMLHSGWEWGESSPLHLPGPGAGIPEVSRRWEDPARNVSPYVRSDPEPSDTGRIEYTVVGTSRPKPR